MDKDGHTKDAPPVEADGLAGGSVGAAGASSDGAALTDNSNRSGGSDLSGGTDGDGLSEDQRDRLARMDSNIQIIEQAAEGAKKKRESDADRVKREKREKSKKLIASVVDGTTALANLYFTTQYAPDAYDPRNSRVDKVNARIEAMKAERKANDDQYFNFLTQLGNARAAKGKALREMQAHNAAMKAARQKAEADAKRLQWEEALQPDKQGEQKGKRVKAEADAVSAQKKADHIDTRLKLEEDYIEAGIGQRNAAAVASRAAAANSAASAEEHRHKTKGGYIDVELPDGSVQRVYDSELDSYYRSVDEDIKKEHHVGDAYNSVVTPSKAEMRQAVTHQLMKHGKSSASKGPGYGGGSGKGKGYGK